MTRTRTEEREEFLRDVLTTAIEGGINYWASVLSYSPVTGTAHVVETEYGDVGEYDGYHKLDLDKIATGVRKLLSGDVAFYPSGYDDLGEFRLVDRTNGEDGDYDAEVADAVVQCAIFGEIIYD